MPLWVHLERVWLCCLCCLDCLDCSNSGHLGLVPCSYLTPLLLSVCPLCFPLQAPGFGSSLIKRQTHAELHHHSPSAVNPSRASVTLSAMPLPDGNSINTAPLDKGEDTEPLIDNDPIPPQCCSARLNLAFLMFCGFSMVYGLRVNLSVAMVAMVNTTEPKPALNSSVVSACPLPPGGDNSSNSFHQPAGVTIPQYPWDSETQGWLLGAFFFGYLCTQIPGGYLSDHYGGSIFLGVGVLVTAFLTLLTPLAAQMGSHWLFALRVLEGIAEGVTFPAMMSMWARWAPPPERSRLITLSASGGSFGAFIVLPLTGLISQSLGWPAVFYLCGVAGCLWAVVWFIFVSDDPRTDRRISKEERDYIIKSIGSQNGFLSALPYLGGWLMSMLSGVVADSLIEREVFSITVVRKLFTLLGLMLPAAFLVAVSFAGCNHILTVTFLTLSTTLGGFTAPGVNINQIDIAPRYAGFLLGISNTFGTIPGVLAPIATGYFTEGHTMAGWMKVFWVSAGINVGGALVYTIFGSGEIQPWANTEDERAEIEKERSMSIAT
ncbi:sialin isoform X3 [Gymnodraco acuticeps]|uniref:Sialin n=1 Tax=Gymnodraco acuticeps TaxID=8218 RepID=A0A6P8TIF1_GYMAC|nr:sialin isoform X3 [Gymnodraco acuticeps]